MLTYGLFADLLDYPNESLLERVNECIPQVEPLQQDSARLLDRFRTDCRRVGIRGLEELYTSTFDMKASNSLYAGYQLFGDEWRRSAFLAGLQETYRRNGFCAGKELPDHLSVMLRFLGAQVGAAEARDLVHECMIPALIKIIASMDRDVNPYGAVLEALRMWLSSLDTVFL